MTVKTAINTRYSCRNYIQGIDISQGDIDTILAAGQKSPNGMGLEPWKFIVLSGDFSKIKAGTNEQQHIQEAGIVIALVNYTSQYVIDNPQVMLERFKEIGLTAEQSDRYFEYACNKGTSYFREQLMFAGSQMVLQATELGIGSTIVGGFDPKQISDILKLDEKYFQVGLLISFGYPQNGSERTRIHRNIDEITDYIKL